MKFEFDPKKSESNLKKHGIDFVQAQELWNDPNYLIIPARSITEKRYALIGKLEKRIWVCIFTFEKQKDKNNFCKESQKK